MELGQTDSAELLLISVVRSLGTHLVFVEFLFAKLTTQATHGLFPLVVFRLFTALVLVTGASVLSTTGTPPLRSNFGKR